MAWYRKVATIVVILTLASPVWVVAQDTPQASVLVGFGNALGWIGGQVEGYVAHGRISAFADEFDPEGSRLQPMVGIGLGYTWR